MTQASPGQRSAEEILRIVAEGTAKAIGEDFFRALTVELPKVLGIRYCLITRRLAPKSSRLTTLAFWTGDSFLENFEYDLAGTPCQQVIAGEACFYPRGIRTIFPEDPDLEELGAESYAAVPFQNSTGEIIGHLAMLDVVELEEDSLDLSILKIFASRAAAEIERMEMEATLLETERTLRQAQKIESLGALAGGIAHDFNNLLVGIQGNAEIALSKLDAEQLGAASAREDVENILKSASRASALSRQMLAYAGKDRLDASESDLTHVIKGQRDLLLACVDKKCILNLDLKEDLPPIEVNAPELQQLLMNLVTNASEALNGNTGTISVSTRKRQLNKDFLAGTTHDDDLGDGLYVMLEVGDTGHGMPREIRERIFDPFFTTRASGRGLGLVTVLGIVRGHRGAIVVDSEVGGGTKVRIYFPVVDQEASAPVESAPATIDGVGRTVLVVDDDPGVRAVARKMLESCRFQVETVSDGIAAINTLRRQQGIAAVLLDMTMPHLNGAQTVRELHRLKPELPVVFTSGYSEQEVRRRLGGGPLIFLQKPFFSEQLQGALASALQSTST